MAGMAVHLNGDIEVPAGDEYDLWLEALNQAQDDWFELDYNWEGLRKTQQTTLLQSGTSVGLPSDFVKLDGFPKLDGKEFVEISIEDTGLYDTGDAYVTIDLADKYMSVSPAAATTITAAVRYWSRPTSLATTSATSKCPSDQYLIINATSKILFSRDSVKYSTFKDEAEALLARMLSKEVTKGIQKDTSIKNYAAKRGFRLGVD